MRTAMAGPRWLSKRAHGRIWKRPFPSGGTLTKIKKTYQVIIHNTTQFNTTVCKQEVHNIGAQNEIVHVHYPNTILKETINHGLPHHFLYFICKHSNVRAIQHPQHPEWILDIDVRRSTQFMHCLLSSLYSSASLNFNSNG